MADCAIRAAAVTATVHQLGDKRTPSLDPMIALTAAT